MSIITRRFPWKQNYRKVPPHVRVKLAQIRTDAIVVSCVKKVPKAEIAARTYRHLGIALEGENLVLPEAVLPNPAVGRYSRINLEGKEVVRRDLPMVTKTFTAETPNWGDWGNGSHTIYWDREVYQRDFIPPKELTISMALIGEEAGPSPTYLIRFTVEQVLDRNTDDFDADLLYNLNLLQENVGVASVFAANASLADYLGTIQVNWEILPEGTREEHLARILSGMGRRTPNFEKTLRQRYDLLASLHPQAFVQGTSQFRRYFGAKFADDLVVFENLEYGNAIYVMYENWQEVSKRSRLDLLKGSRDSFERIVHREGWQDRLRQVIRDHRARRG